MHRLRITLAAIGAMLALLSTTACDPTTSSQEQSQQITNDYQRAAQQAVPYPLDKVKAGGFLERKLLVENLLRQNNPNRLAYVTLLNQEGQPIIQYPIQGMVFSLNSQLTTEDIAACGERGCNVTKAPGDNGTWGPEPGGIGFFTTSGVEIKWNGLYLESDAPQDITTKPLIVYNAGAAPSVTGGQVTPKK